MAFTHACVIRRIVFGMIALVLFTTRVGAQTAPAPTLEQSLAAVISFAHRRKSSVSRRMPFSLGMPSQA